MPCALRECLYFYDSHVLCYKSTPPHRRGGDKDFKFPKPRQCASDYVLGGAPEPKGFGQSGQFIEFVPNEPLNLINPGFRDISAGGNIWGPSPHQRGSNGCEESRRNKPPTFKPREDKTCRAYKHVPKPAPVKSHNGVAHAKTKKAEPNYHLHQNVLKTNVKKTEDYVIHRSYLYRRSMGSGVCGVGNVQNDKTKPAAGSTPWIRRDEGLEAYDSLPSKQSSIRTDSISRSGSLVRRKTMCVQQTQEVEEPQASLGTVSSFVELQFLTHEEICSVIDSPNVIRSLKSFNRQLSRLSSSMTLIRNLGRSLETMSYQSSHDSISETCDPPIKASITQQTIPVPGSRALSNDSVFDKNGAAYDIRKNFSVSIQPSDQSFVAVSSVSETDLKPLGSTESNLTTKFSFETPASSGDFLNRINLNSTASFDAGSLGTAVATSTASRESDFLNKISLTSSIEGEDILKQPSARTIAASDVESGTALNTGRTAPQEFEGARKSSLATEQSEPTDQETPGREVSHQMTDEYRVDSTDLEGAAPASEDNPSVVDRVAEETGTASEPQQASVEPAVDEVEPKQPVPPEHNAPIINPNVIRPLKNLRNNLLLKGFQANVYVVNCRRS